MNTKTKYKKHTGFEGKPLAYVDLCLPGPVDPLFLCG